jgi:hypothetical protein
LALSGSKYGLAGHARRNMVDPAPSGPISAQCKVVLTVPPFLRPNVLIGDEVIPTALPNTLPYSNYPLGANLAQVGVQKGKTISRAGDTSKLGLYLPAPLGLLSSLPQHPNLVSFQPNTPNFSAFHQFGAFWVIIWCDRAFRSPKRIGARWWWLCRARGCCRG